jgi:hypothetical protein
MALYRVFTHTEGDKSVSERLVEAGSKTEAREKAIANVKDQNPGKGNKTQEEAQADTRVLAVRKCGKKGVLTINRFPIAVVESWISQNDDDEGEDDEDE